MRIGVYRPRHAGRIASFRQRSAAMWSVCAVLLLLVHWTFPANHLHAEEEPKAESTVEPKNEAKKVVDDWQKAQFPKGKLDFKAISDREPVQEPLDNPVEFEIFCKMLLYARSVPAEVLERHSRRSIGYESLVNDRSRKDFRGELIRIEGKLLRPVALENALPRMLRDAGAGFLYSAWISVDGAADRPVMVYFTELPKGLGVGERGNFKIEVDGYYLKLMQYAESKDEGTIVWTKKYAPLFLAQTIRATAVEAPPETVKNDLETRIQLNRKDPLWLSVHDEKPLGLRDENPEEYTAYNLVLRKANEFSPADLAKCSRKDIVFADLLGDIRVQFLRDLLQVKGTLVRLRKRDATERLKETTEIKDLYEGWIIHESHEDHMITVVFTELPEGLEPAERMNKKVAFDGYYFKVHAYETKEKDQKGANVWRKAPLLIGRSIEVLEPDPSLWSIANPVVPFILGIIGLGVVAIVVLIVWYRRSDRKVQAKTHEALTRMNPFDERREPPIEPGNAWNRLQE